MRNPIMAKGINDESLHLMCACGCGTGTSIDFMCEGTLNSWSDGPAISLTVYEQGKASRNVILQGAPLRFFAQSIQAMFPTNPKGADDAE